MKGLLKVSLNELNLHFTFQSGQCFRWVKRQASCEKFEIWLGILNHWVIELKQNSTNGYIEWNILNYSLSNDKHSKFSRSFFDNLLKDYFRLNIPLQDYYKKWSKVDNNFAKVSLHFKGIRMLQQDPTESIFTYICSANNNISRIEKMVQSLCIHFGSYLVKDEEFGAIHAFPTIVALAQDCVENKLKQLKFGYRAKYVSQTAKAILNNDPINPEKWINQLKKLDREKAHRELTKLHGIGAKVADCICLMSLDKLDSVPVDTHVWQIATTKYLPHLKHHKTVTDKAYKEIGNFFRQHFGEYAGWAHVVLFCADLKKFKHLQQA